jgi:hypothetical protein
MSQPVKLSDSLVLGARLTTKISQEAPERIPSSGKDRCRQIFHSLDLEKGNDFLALDLNARRCYGKNDTLLFGWFPGLKPCMCSAPVLRARGLPNPWPEVAKIA